MSGLYVPGSDGRMKYQDAASSEERPVLVYEEDTGSLLVNFNMIMMQKRRKLKDIICQTSGGFVQGVVLTSEPLGPAELKRLEEFLASQKGAVR